MKIVVLDGYTLNPGDNPWTGLETLGEVAVFDRTAAEDVLARAEGADVLVTNKVRLGAEIIAALPSLKFIAVTATGHDVVDGAAARARGISVSNVPGYSTPAVAQHVLALLLALASRVAESAAEDWTASPDWCVMSQPMTELAGKTMGVVGFGNIGSEVGKLASAFGMKVLAHAPRPKPQPQWGEVEFVSLEELFRRSDAVSLHCPLTPENAGFINAALLDGMKRSAFLINTARGPLINEPELAEALNTGKIGGAALDVLSAEPPSPENPLLGAKNCIITPHVAWATLEARQRLMSQTVENVRAFADGAVVNVVN